MGGAGATATGLTPGNYIVTVTDKNNCIKTQTLIIGTSINPIATAYKDTTIIPGETANLFAFGGIYYTWSPATGLSCPTCRNTAASPTVTTVYCVTVTDANGCTDRFCVTVTVEKQCGEIYVPTAFSPNGDEENDLFFVKSNCIRKIIFLIYDQWGEKVFETNDPKACWDGIYKNKKMDEAVFVFYLNATLNNNKAIIKRGNITLAK